MQSTQSSSNSEMVKGMVAMLGGMFAFTAVNAILKLSEEVYSPLQLVFFRNLFALIPYLLMLLLNKEWGDLRISNPGIHLVRAALGVVSLSCLFKSVILLPLADAITISYATSLFVVILSIPILGERVSAIGWFAVAMGFLGVLIVAKPTGDFLHLGAIFGIISAFLEAFLMVQGRHLTKVNSNTAIVLYYGLFAIGITGLTMPFVWKTPTHHDWGVLIALGLGGGIGQYLVTAAYRHAPAGLLAPLIYTTLLWSITFGYLFFNEIPAQTLYWGGTLIIAAGLVVMLRGKGEQITEKNPL